jgi:hypothetical protein
MTIPLRFIATSELGRQSPRITSLYSAAKIFY